MGHRASYAIREDGEVALFYSHWGALSVPLDIFWGPEDAEEFVRSNAATDEWLDDVWGEGGVAIDKDTKTVAFFGGELYGETLQAVFITLMRALWPGWTVRWVDGMPDVATTVGVDPAIVTPDPLPPTAVAFDRFGANYREHGHLSALVCVRTKDGGFAEKCFDYGLVYGLMNGPPFVDALYRVPDLEEVADRDGLRESVFVDPIERRIVVAAHVTEDELAHLRQQWDEWTLTTIAGGTAALYEMIGRPLPEGLPEPEEPEEQPPMTREDAIEQIAEALLGSEARKDELQGFVTRAAATAGEGAVFAPNYFDRTPAAPVDAEDRVRLFAEAIQRADWK